MKESSSGVVRTPPKSETIALILSHRPRDDLVVAEPLAALDRPAEEGDLGARGRVAAPRLELISVPAPRSGRPVLVVGPELQRRPALHPVLAVLGREQGLVELDGGAVGVAEHRRHLLLAVPAGAAGPRGAQRQQAAVGEDDADRAPHESGRGRSSSAWRREPRRSRRPATCPATIAACPRTETAALDRRRRTRGARGGDRPRAGARLRLPRPRLRRRDRGTDVYVTFTLTTPACPIGPQVSEQMKEFVGDLPGVDEVHPKMVFDPPWSPEMMSEDAKFALGF